MQYTTLLQPAVRATPALQLWEVYHAASSLAGTLRGAWRGQCECQHLAELLDSVSELLCFLFARYNNKLFLGSLNAHVQSAGESSLSWQVYCTAY